MTSLPLTHVRFTDVVEAVLPAHPDAVELVLERFRSFCGEEGIELGLNAPLEILLAEGLKNAVQHGSPRGALSKVHVSWRLHDRRLEFRIQDEGQFQPPAAVEGQGTRVLRELADTFEHRLVEGRHCLVVETELEGGRVSPVELHLERERVLDAMARELSECYESIVSLLRLGQTLAETVTLYDFLHISMARLRRVIVANCANVRLVNEHRDALRMSYFDPDLDVDMALPEHLLLSQDCLEVAAFRKREEIHLDQSRDLPVGEPLRIFGGPIFIAPVCYQDKVLGTITLVGHARQDFWTAAELNLLRQVADFIGIASVNAQLHEAREQQMKTGRELEIAREIQNSLFPRKMPTHRGYAVHGACRAAQIVGGDFFDVLELEDAGGVLLSIADVIGRGVPAALLASIFRTALHALRDLGAEPRVLLTELNRQLVEDLGTLDVFITAQVAFYSTRKRTLTLATAGHCPLLRFPPGGEPVLEAVEGFPLGLVQETTYSSREIRLARGERLVFMTDGMYEQTNAVGTPLGLPELTQRLRSLAPLPPREVCGAILASVEEYSLGARMADDRTLLVLDCLE
jgi:serine phosphatase RsbU (regulator of sigma subunit)/anti-sigma regulatory factor (Ser/Thr protein kinase)